MSYENCNNPFIQLKYPFPQCNMEFLEYTQTENIGFCQGVFLDGIPFAAELWKAGRSGSLNMTVIMPCVEEIEELATEAISEETMALEDDLENDELSDEELPDEDEDLDSLEEHSLAGFERSQEINTTELLCNDMVIIDEIVESEYLMVLIEYLKEKGIVEFVTMMENGHAYVLEDFDGQIVYAIHITLQDQEITYAKTPLVFQPFYGENVDKVNMKAKLHVVKGDES